MANVDELHTIRVGELLDRVGRLEATQLTVLDEALHFALGLRD